MQKNQIIIIFFHIISSIAVAVVKRISSAAFSMETEDLVYILLLLSSIAFGEVFRRIKDAQLKQNVSTALGVFLVFLVSGLHIAHTIVGAVINGLIISYAHPK